jgi:hypothetical protein
LGQHFYVYICVDKRSTAFEAKLIDIVLLDIL